MVEKVHGIGKEKRGYREGEGEGGSMGWEDWG